MRSRWISSIVVLASVTLACSKPVAGPCRPTHIVRAGEQLPDCTFERIGGGSIALNDLRGKPLVLNFWAEWCVACRKEMPALQAVARAFSGRVQVVGMDGLGVLDETRERAQALLKETGVTYPNAFDVDGRLYAHFFGSLGANPAYPLTVYADAEGIVRKVALGEQTEEDLRSNISEFLGLK